MSQLSLRLMTFHSQTEPRADSETLAKFLGFDLALGADKILADPVYKHWTTLSGYLAETIVSLIKARIAALIKDPLQLFLQHFAGPGKELLAAQGAQKKQKDAFAAAMVAYTVAQASSAAAIAAKVVTSFGKAVGQFSGDVMVEVAGAGKLTPQQVLLAPIAALLAKMVMELTDNPVKYESEDLTETFDEGNLVTLQFEGRSCHLWAEAVEVKNNRALASARLCSFRQLFVLHLRSVRYFCFLTPFRMPSPIFQKALNITYPLPGLWTPW